MDVIITLDKATADALLKLTKAKSMNLAVEQAVEAFIRHEKMRELATYMGKVEILSNDEVEALG